MDFLSTSEMLGSEQYPTTIVGVYELLLQYNMTQNAQGSTRGRRNHRGSGNGTRVSFFQHSKPPPNLPEPDFSIPVPGTDGATVHRQCYKCFKWGHLANKCPNPPAQNVQALQVGISLVQATPSTKSVISSTWILLDTCSTDSVMNNIEFVSNVRNCSSDEVLRIHTNGGQQVFSKIGRLKFLPLTVHVNESSMANILSLKDVTNIDGVRVTMDTDISRSILVQLSSGLTYKFMQSDDGLFYFDTSSPDKHINNNTNHYSFFQPSQTINSISQRHKLKERMQHEIYKLN